MAEYFERQASPAQPGSGIAAMGLDECLPSNEAVKGEADAAAVGFRNARRKHPNAYIAACKIVMLSRSACCPSR